MSKAFTKDDGPSLPEVRRHRPPLPQGSLNYVTTAGLEALRQELARLEHESGGQNAAWRAELEERIASAVVPAPPNDRTEIRFGALVRLRGQDTGDRELKIVGVDEADPAAGLVAFVAPIARALLGRRLGDIVTVRTPGGMEEMEVLGVDYGAR